MHIALINPNTSSNTTMMMAAIAQNYMPPYISVRGLTARDGAPMIVNRAQLHASAKCVVEMAKSAEREGAAGIIISAFGDPGLDEVARTCRIPVTAICQASMLEAGAGGRRFGIATVTPDLVVSFQEKAQNLGLVRQFTGTRLTRGEPQRLVADPQELRNELARAAKACLEQDGAGAVIIGGGPLGEAADALQKQLSATIISPIQSATRSLLLQLG